MNMGKSLCYILIFLFPANRTWAQDAVVVHKLTEQLQKAKEDTAKVYLYIQLGQQFEDNKPEKAKALYKAAGDLSKRIRYPKGIIRYISNYTYVLNQQGLYDSGLILNLHAVNIARRLNDSMDIAKTLFNTGTSYRLKTEFPSAVKYYEEGKKIFAIIGNAETEAIGEDILQTLYWSMRRYDRGIEYGEKAITGLRKVNNTAMLGVALNNLGLNYTGAHLAEKAQKVYEEALRIAIATENKTVEVAQYLNLGDIRLGKQDYETAKTFFTKALRIAQDVGANENRLLALKGLSLYYLYHNNYGMAKAYADSALSLSYRFDMRDRRREILTQLAHISYGMQKPEKGSDYHKQADDLSDSLLNETMQKNAQELEKKYQTATKQLQINNLQSAQKLHLLAIRQAKATNIILIIAATLLIATLLLLYRNNKHKSKIQQQRISELETERQLSATEAVLKGEELERTRLAKDLHDGLGGMLSGIKLSLNTVKGNLVMSADNAAAFERSIDMLDSSIQEMRRVAHNMMPESLVKYGLDTALLDFCKSLDQGGALSVNYQSIGMENATLDPTVAITIYRIVQELLSNILKHAGATSALVQITKSGKNITLTVEDNGKGFSKEDIKNAKGIGWDNIENRISFLQGKLDLASGKEKGSSVFIELTI